MAVKKGLIPLYDAKALMISAIERQAAGGDYRIHIPRLGPENNEVHKTGEFEDSEMTSRLIDPQKRLWLAVIEQAVFDAHLHSTGGAYPSVVWVADARDYFQTKEFELACECLDVAPDWVRSLNRTVMKIAKDLRGKEYESAARPRRVNRKARRVCVGEFSPQMRLAL